MTGCGKTPVGGWHCEGSGCLDAGRVCVHDAADPATAVTDRFALGGFTVSREALGLEPSALEVLAEHHGRMVDALNRQEYVRCAEAYGDAWSPAMAYVHGFAWHPPLNPPRADPGSGADCG